MKRSATLLGLVACIGNSCGKTPEATHAVAPVPPSNPPAARGVPAPVMGPAEDAAEAVTEFGLAGTWATHCTNAYASRFVFTKAPTGLYSVDYTEYSGAVQKRIIDSGDVVAAERLPNDRSLVKISLSSIVYSYPDGTTRPSTIPLGDWSVIFKRSVPGMMANIFRGQNLTLIDCE